MCPRESQGAFDGTLETFGLNPRSPGIPYPRTTWGPEEMENNDHPFSFRFLTFCDPILFLFPNLLHHPFLTVSYPFWILSFFYPFAILSGFQLRSPEINKI